MKFIFKFNIIIIFIFCIGIIINKFIIVIIIKNLIIRIKIRLLRNLTIWNIRIN